MYRLTAAVVFAFTMLIIGRDSQAACMYDVTCIYYTDETMTEECGQTDICPYCHMGSDHWGCQTEYRQCYTIGTCACPPQTPGC